MNFQEFPEDCILSIIHNLFDSRSYEKTRINEFGEKRKKTFYPTGMKTIRALFFSCKQFAYVKEYLFLSYFDKESFFKGGSSVLSIAFYQHVNINNINQGPTYFIANKIISCALLSNSHEPFDDSLKMCGYIFFDNGIPQGDYFYPILTGNSSVIKIAIHTNLMIDDSFHKNICKHCSYNYNVDNHIHKVYNYDDACIKKGNMTFGYEGIKFDIKTLNDKILNDKIDPHIYEYLRTYNSKLSVVHSNYYNKGKHMVRLYNNPNYPIISCGFYSGHDNLVTLRLVCNKKIIYSRGLLNNLKITQFSMRPPEQITNKQLKIISCASYKMYFKITDREFLIIEKTRRQNMFKSDYIFQKYSHNFPHDNRIKIIIEIQNLIKKLTQNVRNETKDESDDYCSE